LLTTIGYGALFALGSTEVVAYASVFLAGAIIGFILALVGAYRVCTTNQEQTDSSLLGSDWVNTKSIVLAALPFAITLGVLPYVIRIEKFILANELGFDEVALFHVAQLAWLAGLLVPQAMRSALLPVLGATRNNAALFHQHLERVESICFALVPIGLVGGASIVWILLPVGFPAEYFDGSLGASARDVFMILLIGWACTVLSVPSYTALQAGEKPWLFTMLILSVVASSTIFGLWLIGWGAETSVGLAIEMAAYASVASSFVMLFLGILLSHRLNAFKERAFQWATTLVVVVGTCIALSDQSYWAIGGLGLFILLPQGLEAMKTTVEQPFQVKHGEAE
jgi:O-antigen/teichoic acid export membrane protein